MGAHYDTGQKDSDKLMREVEYVDGRGRKFMVKLAHDDPGNNPELGIPVGPPDIVDTFDLSEEAKVALHNQLFARKLWNYDEIRKRPKELFAALQAALSISVQKLQTAYTEHEREPEYTESVEV